MPSLDRLRARLLVGAGSRGAPLRPIPAPASASTAQGRIFFVDTGEGVWMVEADGPARARRPGVPLDDPRSRERLWRHALHAPAVERHAGGRPRSDGAALERLSDGGGHRRRALLPEPGADRRLHLVRLPPSGERSDLAVLPAESDGVPLQWLNGVAAGARRLDLLRENAAVRRIDAEGAITTVASAIVVPDCDALRTCPPSLAPTCAALASPPTAPSTSPPTAAGAVLRIAPAGGSAPTVPARRGALLADRGGGPRRRPLRARVHCTRPTSRAIAGVGAARAQARGRRHRLAGGRDRSRRQASPVTW